MQSAKTTNSLSLIADFTDQVLSTGEIAQILDQSVHFISRLAHPSFVAISLFSSADFDLVLEKRLGFAYDRKIPPSLELTDNVTDSIARGGEVLALTDKDFQKYLIFFDTEQHLRCELRLAFFCHSEYIGALSLGKKESGTDYTLQEIDSLRLLVNLIALKCGEINSQNKAEKSFTQKRKNFIFHPRLKTRGTQDAPDLSGNCPAIMRVKELIDRVALEDVAVLISGESGTGKELVARSIHQKSRRSAKPLVAMNCAALSEHLVESELFGHEKGAFTGAFSQKKGKFEFAHESTIFLDEIGDMSLTTQAKLLRVLHDGTFQRVGGNKTLFSNARLLAATNKNLLEKITTGAFREDLYYRINVVQIELPPLRERGEDIILIADHLFQHFNEYYGRNLQGIESDVYEWMLRYEFPGNVRELQNIIERAVIMEKGHKISLDLIPSGREMKTAPTPVPDLSLDQVEKKHIKSVMKQVGNNKSAAARMLGIARKTLREKIQKYNIHLDDQS